jgi:hypothetical protein
MAGLLARFICSTPSRLPAGGDSGMQIEQLWMLADPRNLQLRDSPGIAPGSLLILAAYCYRNHNWRKCRGKLTS